MITSPFTRRRQNTSITNFETFYLLYQIPTCHSARWSQPQKIKTKTIFFSKQ